MKKLLIIAALVLTTAVAAIAQPRAIGGRLGGYAEVSYQHNVGNNFIEVDVGIPGWKPGFGATAIYDFVIAQPQWTPGTWTFYAGPGAQVGMGFDNSRASSSIAVAGQVGLSYRFEFPLELSVDLRPSIGITTIRYNDGTTTICPNFIDNYYIFIPCIGVRYAF